MTPSENKPAPEELDRMVEVARPWLARALADGTYRGLVGA
jgi:hypothetical protein